MNMTTTQLENLLEGLKAIGGWQWDVFESADLELEEIEILMEYTSDLDELATKIDNRDYRMYSAHSYSDLAQEMEEEGILDIAQQLKDNDYYFDYDQLEHDMDCSGDWSEMAWNDASELVDDNGSYIAHLPEELQERITNHWNGEEDDQLKDDLHDHIIENEQTDEWKRDYMEEIVSCSDAEWLSRYFDYDSYGRDLFYNGQFHHTSNGFMEVI